MGISAQPQPSAVSISSSAKSADPMATSFSQQATCTLSFSLRHKDPEALKATFWDWDVHEVALLKETPKQADAEPDVVTTPAAQPPASSPQPKTKPAQAATPPMSAVEKVLNFVTVMWTGGASDFRGGSSDKADDPRLPYRQMDAFAAAFGPMPMGSAITGGALSAVPYSRC